MSGSDWQTLSFSIAPNALIGIGGATDASSTMASVNTFQILSAQNIPGLSGTGFVQGDLIAASAQFDNIGAITAIPEPTTVTALTLLSVATICRRRRKLR
ncbi:MAG: PEP-CTERM sorting domain-containing protein [Planctomycetales bacterium]|nr:PEP-CTERM sorting domain-containing protein [Planctomycetales bacterium]